ncbi:MAG: PAS domain-containing protein [Desulfamplus sp.]|nr:PAS domain-containing protein [Desulfamplus sp.]
MMLKSSNNKQCCKDTFQVYRWKLRTHLLILIFIIFIPVLGLLIFLGYDDRQQSLENIEEQSRQMFKLFVDEQVSMIDTTLQLLEILSHIPAVYNLELGECNTILNTVKSHTPEYSTIVAADKNGVINCCAVPIKEPIDVKDRSWFKRIVQTREFVIDDFLISRSAHKASLPFAYPILDDLGNLKVAVGAAFDLSYYSHIFNRILLPPESVIIITDKKEDILYISGLSKENKTSELLGQPLVKIRGFGVPTQSKGNFTVIDSDNVERIYWFENLSVGQSSNNICLFVGFSKKVIFDKANQLMLRNISLLALFAILSFGFTWFFCEKSIVKPINLLVQKIQTLHDKRVPNIEIGVSKTLFHPTQELELLSTTFEDLMNKLSQREKERNQAEESVLESKERLESVLKGSQLGYWDWDITTGKVERNERWADMLGYTLSEIELNVKQWTDLHHPDDREAAWKSINDHLEGKSDTHKLEYRMLAKDGSYKWILDCAKIVKRDPEGRPLRMSGTHTDITERKKIEEDIRKLNAELENRVLERTALFEAANYQLEEINKQLELANIQLESANSQLNATNKELEAFSYSVSHDLRAPLRSIDGWSLALVEEFEEIIGEEGKRYIERIRTETQRMGQLIDSLLKLSRITKSEMFINQVNISELASNVAGKLKESYSENIKESYPDNIKKSYPESTVEFIIEPDLTVYADQGMMDIVLTNLIGNALKFTGKQTIARIEFGKLSKNSLQNSEIQSEYNGKQIFFIKDNGAGFDMKYSGKLFGAFQRLHKESEFPGTGIGLATVQRIIHKHGGRVWAEGEVNKGATFYFTL